MDICALLWDAPFPRHDQLSRPLVKSQHMFISLAPPRGIKLSCMCRCIGLRTCGMPVAQWVIVTLHQQASELHCSSQNTISQTHLLLPEIEAQQGGNQSMGARVVMVLAL